jgi:hypothetical protein
MRASSSDVSLLKDIGAGPCRVKIHRDGSSAGMILRQLLGISDRQLVSHGRFSHLVFRKWLDDLVVNEQ